MRLKDLFTVPTGQKVTEEHLRRVLISSICSILLCMTCLVSTTWAWFAVSIENTDNVIQIGTPEVTVTVGNESVTTGKHLSAGEHLVKINRTVNQDDLHQKMEFFVILTIQSEGETAIYQIAVSESSSVTITTNGECKLSWVASWFTPANADEISDGVIVVATEEDTVPSTEPTTTPSSEVGTDPSTEAATEPSAETTTTEATEAATEATTVPAATEEMIGETENTIPATEETPIPDADATTVPTSIPTDTTEPVTEPDGTTSPIETG